MPPPPPPGPPPPPRAGETVAKDAKTLVQEFINRHGEYMRRQNEAAAGPAAKRPRFGRRGQEEEGTRKPYAQLNFPPISNLKEHFQQAERAKLELEVDWEPTPEMLADARNPAKAETVEDEIEELQSNEPGRKERFFASAYFLVFKKTPIPMIDEAATAAQQKAFVTFDIGPEFAGASANPYLDVLGQCCVRVSAAPSEAARLASKLFSQIMHSTDSTVHDKWLALLRDLSREEIDMLRAFEDEYYRGKIKDLKINFMRDLVQVQIMQGSAFTEDSMKKRLAEFRRMLRGKPPTQFYIQYAAPADWPQETVLDDDATMSAMRDRAAYLFDQEVSRAAASVKAAKSPGKDNAGPAEVKQNTEAYKKCLNEYKQQDPEKSVKLLLPFLDRAACKG